MLTSSRSDAPQSRPIRVLLADDHAVVRDGLKALLEVQDGVSVVGEVESGREAVERVRELNPDVVVMDIAMPDLNGVEATAQIREGSPRAKVVVLSMYGTKEHVFRALRAGAHGYLLKQSAGAELIGALRAVHEGRQYLDGRLAEFMFDECVYGDAAGPRQSPLERLSGREREVLQLVVEGKSSREIAEMIHLSPKSVETYRSRLMRKLEIHDVPSLVKFAIQHGLTSEV